MLRVCRGFLDHERAPGVGLPWGAEVFDVVEGAQGEVVDADAVVVVVDCAGECGDEAGFVGVAETISNTDFCTRWP